jgi:hypothetical protein
VIEIEVVHARAIRGGTLLMDKALSSPGNWVEARGTEQKPPTENQHDR